MEVGSKLKNGATVLAFRAVSHKRVVLAEWSGSSHPFVTWRVDQEGNTFLGHYFSDQPSAEADFNTR